MKDTRSVEEDNPVSIAATAALSTDRHTRHAEAHWERVAAMLQGTQAVYGLILHKAILRFPLILVAAVPVPHWGVTIIP